MAMGFTFLAFLVAARQTSAMKPNMFWLSAVVPLTSVILSTTLSRAIHAQDHHIQTIGKLKVGMNPSSMNLLHFNGSHFGLAISTGLLSGILALTEGIAVGRTFASIEGYHVDGNKEMIAIGTMNMVGSCTSCYVTTGSFSRSAVNYNAGSQSAVSNLVMAVAVLLTMVFLLPLFWWTPNVILSAIIVTDVIGLIDFKAAVMLWKVDKYDFFACICAFFGVLLVSVEMGLLIAVAISVIKILIYVTRPNTVVIGQVPGTQIYRNIGQYEEATMIPSFLIIGIECPIFFANSIYLQERIMRWVREGQERAVKEKADKIVCVILDLSPVTAIDTSGMEALKMLKKSLEQISIELLLANPVGSVVEKLHKSNAINLLGPDSLYFTVGEAISSFSMHHCEL